MKMIQKISEYLLDLIWPCFCGGCQKMGSYLCRHCYQHQPLSFEPLPLHLNLAASEIDQINTMAEYEGLIKALITQLKYQPVKNLGNFLGRLMFYTTNFPPVEAITFVPLHPLKKIERGFNQAEKVAIGFAQAAKLPLLKTLIRTTHLTAQASITHKEERLTRLKGIFKAGAPPPTHCQNSILIIDDVTTTGSTLSECAAALKQAGWKKVYGLTVAHGN